MKERLNYAQVSPDALKAMRELEKYVAVSGLERPLYELVKTRASQINGCAYCIDMHTQEALKIGETQRRIFAVSAWKESPLYTKEERAVLQLTEEVTLISADGVSDETYEQGLRFYGKNMLAQIIMQIVIINSWNRIAVSTMQIFEQS